MNYLGNRRQNNPFTVMPGTEMLLIKNEIERKERAGQKEQYQQLCVWDKAIANRGFNRQGVIREVKKINAQDFYRSFSKLTKKQRSHITTKQKHRVNTIQTKKKQSPMVIADNTTMKRINVIDTPFSTESGMIKRMNELEGDLMIEQEQKMAQTARETALSNIGGKKQANVDYLKTQRESS